MYLERGRKNYPVHDFELLHIVDTLRAWRSHLHRQKCIISTDLLPLTFVETQYHLSPRKVRWLKRLVVFVFPIIPMKRKSENVEEELPSSQEAIRKNTEHLRDLLKNVLQKAFETNAISRTLADPSVVN